jgi:hypothetical protein
MKKRFMRHLQIQKRSCLFDHVNSRMTKIESKMRQRGGCFGGCRSPMHPGRHCSRAKPPRQRRKKARRS